jgi:cbb3-type cytochrome oxidase subunit 3
VDALVGTIFFWFGVLFAVVLIGIPFLLMGHAARKRGRAAAEGKLDVLANGVASQGRVTHLENVQPIHDRGRAANVSASWRIHFEHVVQGRVFAGASALTALRPDGFAPGMPVWIVRDPADPTRAEIWPPVT